MSERTCDVPGCGRKHFGHGYCKRHHYRWSKYGDPLIGRGGFRSDTDRFWSKVDKGQTDGCWVWTKATDRDGYGHFKAQGRMWRAPRWIYEQINGPLPEEQQIRHHCDNPSCVRPDHLTVGLAADNSADAVARGRTARGVRHGSHVKPETRMPGEKNTQAKLTAQQVVEIRRRYADGEPQVALAAEYGVTQINISLIVRRKTWKHLKE